MYLKSKNKRYQPKHKYLLQILAYNGQWVTIASTSMEENYTQMKTSQKYFEYKRGIPCRIKYNLLSTEVADQREAQT